MTSTARMPPAQTPSQDSALEQAWAEFSLLI
jgi:hypothetical protein